MDCPELKKNDNGVAGPVVLVVMDGVGIGRGDEADAVALASTPNLDRYATGSLSGELAAHGVAVGMPSDKDMGNSEVGHNALGAGRVFDQGAKLVKDAIGTGRLYEGQAWRGLVTHLEKTGGALHLFGLLSDGNVHSHIDHVKALITRAHEEGLPRVFVHALLDGRDVPKTSALEYVDDLEAHLAELDGEEGKGQEGHRYRVASGGGRMITTMDRYGSDWRIVERGWQAHVHGEARRFPSLRGAIETYRQEMQGILDQNLPPLVVEENGEPVATMRDGDAVIAFNFRGDRMLQICAAFEDEAFDKFDRGRVPDLYFAGMTLYDGDEGRPGQYLVAPPEITCTIGELLCHAGVGQVACSETQKYGHVTYFWNGNRTGYFDESLETYIEVPSNLPPFDERPEMKADEITDAVLAEMASGKFRFLRLNYANGDMVGHTGSLPATIKSVEAVDRNLARVEEAVLKLGGALIVTADHGNADDMAERDKKTGEPKREANGNLVSRTSHSLNPVPFHVILPAADQARFRLAEVEAPGIGNLAATLASLLGFDPPAGYLPPLIETVTS